MTYLFVQWTHNSPSEPVLLFSELDGHRWERRKVHVYSNGDIEFADATHETDTCGLGLVPVPSSEEIAADPQFMPHKITQDDFENLWQAATQQKRLSPSQFQFFSEPHGR